MFETTKWNSITYGCSHQEGEEGHFWWVLIFLTHVSLNERQGSNLPIKPRNPIFPDYCRSFKHFKDDHCYSSLMAYWRCCVLNGPYIIMCIGPSDSYTLGKADSTYFKRKLIVCLGNDCSYSVNLHGEALQEELLNIAYYSWCACVILVIGDAGHWDSFLFKQRRREKHLLEDSIHNPMLHHNTCM